MPQIRLIIKPEAAFLAANKANDHEIIRILHYGKLNEIKLLAQENRNAEGARTAMKLHILHAIDTFDIQIE